MNDHIHRIARKVARMAQEARSAFTYTKTPSPYLITSYARIERMNILLLVLGYVLGIATMYFGG